MRYGDERTADDIRANLRADVEALTRYVQPDDFDLATFRVAVTMVARDLGGWLLNNAEAYAEARRGESVED